jgi:hypothetical protein
MLAEKIAISSSFLCRKWDFLGINGKRIVSLGHVRQGDLMKTVPPSKVHLQTELKEFPLN